MICGGGLLSFIRIPKGSEPLNIVLELKNKNECRWDAAALGEILLRFDPGDRRISNAREFLVWDGGAEYNVAANLSRVFDERCVILTALADNALGRLAVDLARQAAVDTSQIIWREYDGIGNTTRNALYFIERGQGVRGPSSAFDRGNTAVSQLGAGDLPLAEVFADGGVRWFHTGGVFTGLSATTPEAAIEALSAANAGGSAVSYDLNYRDSLWANRGGKEAANAVNRILLPFADVVFGTFGFDSALSRYDEAVFRSAAEAMLAEFPKLKMVVSTLRETHSASRHDIGGVCLVNGKVYRAADVRDIEVIDRVGSGDAFASAFIYAALEGADPQTAIDMAAAHGALAMTTPGDGSMATAAEVAALAKGGHAGVKR